MMIVFKSRHFCLVCYCSLLTYVQTIKDENWILMWWWQRTSLVFYKQMTSNFQLLSAELQLASLGPGHLLDRSFMITQNYFKKTYDFLWYCHSFIKHREQCERADDQAQFCRIFNVYPRHWWTFPLLVGS